MRSSRLPVLLCSLFLLSMAPLMPATADESASWHDHVVISEVLVSASSKDYNGTDWNGDGDIGSYSDQYIELWNSNRTNDQYFQLGFG